jgi:UDP-N-acetylmuramate dehydrogenase
VKPPRAIRENVSLAGLTSYRIGGPARYYAKPEDVQTLLTILRWAHETGLPTFTLGAGSNLLVSDRGYPGLVLHLQGFLDQKTEPTPAGNWEVGAGTLLTRWVRHTVACGLAGAEALIGIPGTLGGALRMNAGAFSVEISQLLIDTDIIRLNPAGTAAEPQIERLANAAIRFAYRSAPGLKDTIIIKARFQLTPGDKDKLTMQAREVTAIRRNRQPLERPSCGSVFKRPEGDFAGRLIEAAGLKGLACGGAQISPKHCNFIVNLGNASAVEVLSLIKTMKKRVFDHSGVTLEREVILVGFEEDELAGA